MNLWPPFLFSGIKIVKLSKDFRCIQVKLKHRFWNANYVGTQFGGSIFAMADPFYMLMLIENLGPEYVVWDKATSIAFVKPGRTDLITEFTLTDDDLAAIREAVADTGRLEWKRAIDIRDISGELIAHIDKTISIKKKKEQ